MMMAACTSDEFTQQPSQPEADGSKGIPFTATISSKAATRAITEKDDGTLETSWGINEEVALIHEDSKGNTVVDKMTVSAVDATTKTATITGTITGSPANGDEVRLIFPYSAANENGEIRADLLNVQAGTLDYIQKNLDLRVSDIATPTKLKVSDGNATIDGTATLKNELAIVKFSLKDGSDALAAESFKITDVDGQPIITVEPSPAASDLYVAMESTAPNTTQAFGFVAKKGDNYYYFSKSGITIEASKYYQQTLALADMLHTPLTLEAAVAGAKVTFKADNANVAKDIEYSTDGGATWTSGNTGGSGVEVTLANIGDKVMFCGDNSPYGKDNGSNPATCNTISCTADCYVYGNIMSLIDKTGFATNKVLPTGTNTFYYLFKDNTYLKNHPNAAYTLELPATTLKEYCYRSMFSGCKALVTPPALPATKLENSCYSSMFRSCFSMVTPPALPATELKDNCYDDMFENCTSLETTPRLPATELKNGCYYSMFEDCTSLKEAWVKANVKVGAPDYECDKMFYGCTNASTSQFHTGDSKDNWTAAFPNLSQWQFSAYE